MNTNICVTRNKYLLQRLCRVISEMHDEKTNICLGVHKYLFFNIHSTEEAISSPEEDVLDFRQDIINVRFSQKTATLPEKTPQMTSIHEEMAALRGETTALRDETTVNTEVISLIQKYLKLLRQSMHGPSIINNGERKSKDRDSSNSEEEGLGEDDVELLPHDTFSFIAVSRVKSRFFWIGAGVFAMQVVAFLFLCLDMVDARASKNPMGVPPNVPITVRVCQVLAIIISVLSEDNLHHSLNPLFRGYEEAAVIHYFGKKPMFLWFLSIL